MKVIPLLLGRLLIALGELCRLRRRLGLGLAVAVAVGGREELDLRWSESHEPAAFSNVEAQVLRWQVILVIRAGTDAITEDTEDQSQLHAAFFGLTL
jgi:hypothetical protein